MTVVQVKVFRFCSLYVQGKYSVQNYNLSTHHLSSHLPAGHNNGTSIVVSYFPVEDAILEVHRSIISAAALSSHIAIDGGFL